MIVALTKYYFALQYWNRASLNSIKNMQVKKFRDVFEHARKHSRFYRDYYGDHGISDLKIRSVEDIKKVPLINKTLLRNNTTGDIMTRNIDGQIHIHSTSGSSGEPFKIAFNRYEDYTAHVRVFWALRKAGYKSRDKIVMITRYNPKDKFEIERELSTLCMLQGKLKRFQREIISIYDPVDKIIANLLQTRARILWSTPSILQIVCNRLKEKSIRFDFPIVFLTSEVITPRQKGLFYAQIGKTIVNLYGTIESPSLGIDIGLEERFVIFPNSNYFEFVPFKIMDSGKMIARVLITNLINKTMPVIRYDLGDLAEIEDSPDFGHKYLTKIVGREDDIIDLGNGKLLAHHHAHEMFMDFHECDMFKFIEKADKKVCLQLQIARGHDKAQVENLAIARWRKRFADVPLDVEFVDQFPVHPLTGKFKNIEKADGLLRPQNDC